MTDGQLLGTTGLDGKADERLDSALEAVLRAAGTSLKHYMPGTKDAMREAMREVMSASYKTDTVRRALDRLVQAGRFARSKPGTYVRTQRGLGEQI